MHKETFNSVVRVDWTEKPESGWITVNLKYKVQTLEGSHISRKAFDVKQIQFERDEHHIIYIEHGRGIYYTSSHNMTCDVDLFDLSISSITGQKISCYKEGKYQHD